MSSALGLEDETGPGWPPPTFIVGTGRTGSTALSTILNAHPDVLSLNEYFVSISGLVAFPRERLSGGQFWDIISKPHPVFDQMLRSGEIIPEFVLREAIDFPDGSIPAIMLMTLPHLSDQPARVYHALASEVPRWSQATAGEHHRRLFRWLSRRFRRAHIVERSGHSLGWLPELRSAFPDGRFVHMYRNGPDCALSMSSHRGFQSSAVAREMMRICGVKHFSEIREQHLALLPQELAELFPDRVAEAFQVNPNIPLASFGEMWSDMVTSGVRELSSVAPDRKMALRFEDLVSSPQYELVRLAKFLGLPALREWVAFGTSLLDQSRPGAALLLPPNKLRALRMACVRGEHSISQFAESGI